jgi:hypothetical protein
MDESSLMTLEEIRKEAERLEEDILYSEKSRYAMATLWGRAHYGLGIPSAIAAAVSGVSAVKEQPDLAVVASVVAAVLASLMTFLDTEKRRSDHFIAGNRYASLRGDLRRFRNITIAAQPAQPNEAVSDIMRFGSDKRTIQEAAPHIGGLAYRLGKRSIEQQQHAYRADAAS